MSASALGSWFSSAGATFLLIALAEFGDKSQLVCMTLAARHRGLPVILGAVTAFGILNLLAVLFGAAVAAWLPEWLITLAVAVLFAAFGISALRYQAEIEDESVEEKAGHSVAVAGMGSTINTAAVWLGATLALTFTSVLAVIAGRNFLHRLPLLWIHRISGAFFLLLAGLAIARLIYSGL